MKSARGDIVLGSWFVFAKYATGGLGVVAAAAGEFAAFFVEGCDEVFGVGVGGDDEHERVAAAVAGGEEAAGVGAFDAHFVATVRTFHRHGSPQKGRGGA